MQLAGYLRNIPKLHCWDGKTWNTGGFDRHAFELLDRLIEAHLPLHPAFIETGAGNSTIFFLLHGPSQVTSIAPDRELFERIRAYCEEHGISQDALSAHIAQSQWVLPQLAGTGQSRFDFALIDGNHGMSMVFVDFHYLNALVRRGGLIMIDDIHLHSAGELARLLREQWGYEVVLDEQKFVVFRKMIDAREMPDFGGQPYVMRRSGLTQL
jgi:hypothetical protein